MWQNLRAYRAGIPERLARWKRAEQASQESLAQVEQHEPSSRDNDAQDYIQLNLSINTLSKKHSQLKGVIQVMVELAMSWLDEIKQQDGIETWLELVETLCTITEGKARHSQLYRLVGLSVLTCSFSCFWRHREPASCSPLPTTTNPCIETRDEVRAILT